MAAQFMISSTQSGGGKTTVTLGLLRALARRGHSVQPFKCGPDYIDTKFHRIASGRESINLDSFMSSAEHVRGLFSHYGADADVRLVEGVGGFFDGYDHSKGSSCEIAKTLNLPVVLVINAASVGYSVGATILGFKNFDPQANVAGVIFNNVGSATHFQFLKSACDEVGLPCFGYVKRNKAMAIPSRHLGLTILEEEKMNDFIDLAADMVEEGVDFNAIIHSFRGQAPEGYELPELPKTKLRIAMASDEAFNFIYPHNVKRLEQAAVDGIVHKFSPLRDGLLPEADLIYLPGGYPELFAEQLTANKAMRQQINDFAERGGMIFAECGGMIYLTQMLDGHDMCGVLPLKTSMENPRLHLGYRIIDTDAGQYRGHEFHYSEIAELQPLTSIARQFNARGGEVATPLYRYKNVIAGYTHFYWGETNILNLWQ